MENLILPALVLAVYLGFIFPQLKRRRDYRTLQSSLAEGDEVVMNSGVHGFITALDETIVYVEVAEGVELKYTRSSIASRLDTAEADEDA